MFVFKGVRSIKSGENTENKKVIGYTNSPGESVKSILPKFSITIVSFGETTEKPEGNLYEFGIDFEGKKIDIIISIEGKIRDAFKTFITDFGIEQIDYVKPYGSDISKEKQDAILSKLKAELFENKGNKSEKEVKTKVDKTENIDKGKLDVFRKEVTEFIKEMNELIGNTKNIFPDLSGKLQNETLDLLKFRSTTNIVKIAEHYKKALELSSKLYNQYYDYQKEQEKNSLSKEVISNIDIIKEYKQYQKVVRVKSIESSGGRALKFPWYEVIYYKVFGKYGVNLKLLFLEITKKYKLNYFGSEDILKFIQFVILFLIIEYSLFLFYKLFLNLPESEILSIYYMILNISILGFIVTFGKMFIKKIGLFLSIILMIILYFIFSYIKTYFGF